MKKDVMSVVAMVELRVRLHFLCTDFQSGWPHSSGRVKDSFQTVKKETNWKTLVVFV